MILVYCNNKEKQAQIYELCKEKQEEVKPILPKMLKKTINAICYDTDETKQENIPMMYNLCDCMLLCDMSDEKMEEFLDAYKEKGIEKIDIKAVVTPFNRKWSLYELVEHLKKEHREMEHR